jgi:hypothetical protein
VNTDPDLSGVTAATLLTFMHMNIITASSVIIVCD